MTDERLFTVRSSLHDPSDWTPDDDNLPDWRGLTCPLRVDIFESRDEFNAWCEKHGHDHGDGSDAITTYTEGPLDPDEDRIVVSMPPDIKARHVLVHEAVHVALFMYSERHLRRRKNARARRHVTEHSEELAYQVPFIAILLEDAIVAAGGRITSWADGEESSDGTS